MKFLQSFLALAFLVLATTSWAQKDKLPNVSLKDINGKTVELSKMVKPGELTVISFWATWCAPCKKELDNMMDLYGDWQKNYKAHIIAVSVDDARTSAKVKPTVNAKGWDYTILLDSNEDLKRALNINSVPFTIVVNQKGEIVYQHAGYKDGDEDALGDKLKALSKK